MNLCTDRIAYGGLRTSSTKTFSAFLTRVCHSYRINEPIKTESMVEGKCKLNSTRVSPVRLAYFMHL